MSTQNPIHSCQNESIGKRISRLRSERGWTQQTLASRLAMSRVAVSHIEMDLTIPSERTIVLLAGLFKLNPFEMVDGTTYPQAKAERLPPVAARYTQFEMDMALFKNDMSWLEKFAENGYLCEDAEQMIQIWLKRFASYSDGNLNNYERDLLGEARSKLKKHLEQKK